MTDQHGNPYAHATTQPVSDPGSRKALALAAEERDGYSVLGMLSILLKRRKMVLGIPAIATAVTLLYSLILQPLFTAAVAFVPESRSQDRLPASLAILAGQVGISVGSQGSQSPRFYAELVKSREIMERILKAQFPEPGIGSPVDSASLLQLLDEGGKDAEDSLFRAMERLRESIWTSVDNQTGIVRLTVGSRDPRLAAAVANRFVAYLNEFNAKTRQSQARMRRRFVEERLAEAEQELRRTEEDLKTFYERNRSWEQAPQLRFEEGRLRQQVDIRRELYVTLQRDYETARIEEVNDTPVITVIDPAVPANEPSRPKRTLLVMMAILFGGVVGVTLAYVAESMDRLRRDGGEDYNQFSTLLGDVIRQVKKTPRNLFRSARTHR